MSVNLYLLNNNYIKKPESVDELLNKYFYKNIIKPKDYIIEDSNVTLVYKDLDFLFPTYQNESLINLYESRFRDLYTCCFRTNKLKVYMQEDFLVNLNDISNNKNSVNGLYSFDITYSNNNCFDINDSDCLFFQRFYCKGLREFVGPENLNKMDDFDSNCQCYKFDNKYITMIKLGSYVNCFDKTCQLSGNKLNDPVLTNEICNLNVCQNIVNIRNIISQKGIKIDDIISNLDCA